MVILSPKTIGDFMKIDSLYEYVVFAKHLNFSEAARELYLSQPGLSVHISNLEKELGFTLVNREGGPSLTSAGLVFLDCAQDVLDRYRSGLDEAKKLADAPPFVRFLSSPDSPLILDMLAQTKDIPFTFVNIDSETPVLRALQKNTLDIGHCVNFSHNEGLRKEAEENGIAWFPFAKFRGSISLMKTHPLAQKESLTREDLIDASIVINGGAHYDSWKTVVQRAIGEHIPLKFRLDPIGSISNLRFADFGESIHICGEQANETYLSHRDDVVIFESLDGEPILYTSVFAYRKNDPNQNVHRMIASFKEQLGISD